MSSDDEGFLNRWSRRKLAKESEAEGARETSAGRVPGHETAEADAASNTVTPHDTAEGRQAETDAKTEERFEDVDFDALDANSDYTRFMGANVPESVRNQALQRLWVSDPILANIDGLTDYSDDFTDAALAVPLGALKTAHKIGRGFLSDDDVAEWEALGRDARGEEAAPPTEPATEVWVAVESPMQDEVRALFAASNAHSAGLYPAESNHPVSPEALVTAGAVFLVAREADGSASSVGRGRAVGCGALLVASDGSAELKRMWVEPDQRGKGIGRRLLDALLGAARARDVQRVRLETGVKQPAAIALYEKAGFGRRPPFGGYAEDPNSIFMELVLPGASADAMDQH